MKLSNKAINDIKNKLFPVITRKFKSEREENIKH